MVRAVESTRSPRWRSSLAPARSLDALVVERKINPALVTSADREAPSGRDWARLRKLMGDTAERVAARLGKQGDPVVLGDLGLAARFGLGALLQGLLDASRRDDGPAVFLVVPRFGEGVGVAVDGGAVGPLPMYSPAQRMDVPRAWVENRHRGEG